MNSDGMDITSSSNVTIRDCFIRTFDDSITIKTIARNANSPTPQDAARNIVVQGNVLWVEGAHGLTIGTQEEATVNTVTFSNIDIIRAIGRTPTLAIDQSGSAEVGNVRFENIRIDASGNPFDKAGVNDFVALLIYKNAVFQRQTDINRQLGKMRGVLFNNVQIKTSPTSPKVRIQVVGASDTSNIQDVKFDNVTVNGHPLSKANTVVVEKFATQVTGLP